MQALCRSARLPTHHAARSTAAGAGGGRRGLKAGALKELDRSDVDGDDVDSAVASAHRIALDNLA